MNDAIKTNRTAPKLTEAQRRKREPSMGDYVFVGRPGKPIAWQTVKAAFVAKLHGRAAGKFVHDYARCRCLKIETRKTWSGRHRYSIDVGVGESLKAALVDLLEYEESHAGRAALRGDQ